MKGKPTRLATMRRLLGCDHLRVNINAIVKAYSDRTHSRTVGGQCQDCVRRVERTEAKDGTPLTAWTSNE